MKEIFDFFQTRVLCLSRRIGTNLPQAANRTKHRSLKKGMLIIMSRVKKLLTYLPEEADGILVTNYKNQYYLSGFDFMDGFVLITRKKSYLLTDFRYIEAARVETDPGLEVVQMDQNFHDELIRELLRENGVRKLAYEDDTLPCATKTAYETGMLRDVELIPSGGAIGKMRIRKDQSEIDAMITAQRIAEQAFEHILGYITPERTEIDVALELEFFMRSHGAKAVSFDTIAVSGSASSRPHGVPRNVKLEEGFLTMDYGALYQGYCSDMTRTVCVGRCTDEMRTVYNTVLEAQLTALDAYALGKTGIELDAVARKVITDAGYGEYFGHGLGHGVGMDIHEAPFVNKKGDVPMEPGHVVTCEPGIYLPGKFGVRIEDMVVFTGDGAVDITHCPKELIIL